jgi:hypothetical protein
MQFPDPVTCSRVASASLRPTSAVKGGCRPRPLRIFTSPRLSVFNTYAFLSFLQSFFAAAPHDDGTTQVYCVAHDEHPERVGGYVS